eukprot:COSAG02_NODE_31254_length_536_cov_1.681922_1_plen_146_part_00
MNAAAASPFLVERQLQDYAKVFNENQVLRDESTETRGLKKKLKAAEKAVKDLSAVQKKLEAAEEKIKDLTANLEKEKEASRRLAVKCGNLPAAKDEKAGPEVTVPPADVDSDSDGADHGVVVISRFWGPMLEKDAKKMYALYLLE